MKDELPIDIPRLIRVLTLLVAILVGTLVYFRYQPRIDALRFRVADAESTLRSEEVAVHETPHLREERNVLAARYAHLMTKHAEALFLKDLILITHAQALTLVATSFVRTASAGTRSPRAEFLSQTHVTLELRGTYRHLLVGISKLSTGSEIVGVEAPSFHRDGEAVIASVPITIYEPIVESVPTP